jgi:hypothetical protein
MVRSAKDPKAAPPREDGPGPAELAELALVVVAVTQGALVGAWLGLFPELALRLGGFPPAPAFFVRWAGLLQLILALGYALEWVRFRRVTLIVLAKGATAIFLAAAWAGDGLPWLMVLALLLESAMAVCGALLHGPAERSRRARARLRLVTPAPPQIRPAGRR